MERKKRQLKRLDSESIATKKSFRFLLEWRVLLSRYFNPHRWTLRGRFLYMSGTLLVIGNIILILYISSALESAITRDVGARLQLLQSQTGQSIDLHRRLLDSSLQRFADSPDLVRALSNGQASETSVLINAFAQQVRRDTGLQTIQISFARHNNGDAQSPPPLSVPELPGLALLNKAMENDQPLAGMVVGPHGPLLASARPVFSGREQVGSVAVTCSMQEILDSLTPHENLNVVALVHVSLTERLTPGTNTVSLGEWLVLTDGLPFSVAELPSTSVQGGGMVRQNDRFHLIRTVRGADGGTPAALLLTFDAQRMLDEKWDTASQFAWLFIVGAMILWTTLYLNVRRLERFMGRLKKIILSSHSNYFAERFESDPGHCLEMMHCTEESCPVYKDPSLVCYLVTGSEAISPKWRNTCVFLDKYETCSNCPVYTLRRGDEITEMRNVVNTMMGLWSNFLSRVGQLLTYVFRSQDSTEGNVPSLDEISARLEQLAGLTFFGQDLQGAQNKGEIYRQLNHVFTTDYGIPVSIFFEVDHKAGKFKVVHDNSQDNPLCKKQVIQSAESCRVKRMAEEVLSYYNPETCPYFNCDFATEVRCCLPIVMSGQVGGVFSFVISKEDWTSIRRQLPVIRKYLDESAPVLNSMHLLMLTREQSLRDPLTQTRNRRFLEEFITSYEPLAEREKKRAGILMLDLDHFKRVNDEFGHGAGDAVLKQVVQVVENNVRRSDLIIRYGGEEFLVFMRNVADESMTRRVAEKIRTAIEEHRFALPDGQHISMTVTIGLALHPVDAPTVQEVVKFADMALYQGKNSGRNRVVRFKPEMREED